MVFPLVDNIPRHPSQIYQLLGEGVLLGLVLWIYSSKPRRVGQVSGFFLLGYGICRFMAEYAREPDAFLGLLGLLGPLGLLGLFGPLPLPPSISELANASKYETV